MTDDRLARSPAEPTERIPARRSPSRRPAPIPVRRGQAKPVPQSYDPGDAHTEEMPVMSDEEFEAIQAAATRRVKGEPEPVAAQPEPEPTTPATPRRRTFLGGITGSLTAATVIIALIAIAAQVLSSTFGKPGPGIVDVVGQALLALFAIVAQRGVDRRRGARRGWSAVLVLVFAAASFGVFWLAWLWLFWSV
ncbi:MAG TPA: hypothetical protein VHZ97_01365 [Pseudonocardiaceae bacterium]|jgi:hypothetical protein|nr:hypothetical protein [Pseudonocardiaceae bacterium]